jgi:hypothetical protein
VGTVHLGDSVEALRDTQILRTVRNRTTTGLQNTRVALIRQAIKFATNDYESVQIDYRDKHVHHRDLPIRTTHRCNNNSALQGQFQHERNVLRAQLISMVSTCILSQPEKAALPCQTGSAALADEQQDQLER